VPSIIRLPHTLWWVCCFEPNVQMISIDSGGCQLPSSMAFSSSCDQAVSLCQLTKDAEHEICVHAQMLSWL